METSIQIEIINRDHYNSFTDAEGNGAIYTSTIKLPHNMDEAIQAAILAVSDCCDICLGVRIIETRILTP